MTALPFASPAAFRQPDSLAAIRQLSQLSCKLLACLQSVSYGCTLSAPLHTADSESSCTRSGPLQSVTPALTCQLSCNLTAALHGSLLALAAAGQLSCSLSARLPRSQSSSNCQLRCTPFSPSALLSPSAISKLVAVSQHCCTVSTPSQLCLHYVSPAAICQLSCILSAQLHFFCSRVFCHAVHLL